MQEESFLEKEITWSESSDLEFFKRQLENPYDSTKQFFEFISKEVTLNSQTKLIDACSGSGAASIYALSEYKCKEILAFDFQKKYLEIGKQFISKKDFKNKIKFIEDDVYNLSNKVLEHKFDGVICLASLSWINDWEKALNELSKTKTSWIALSAIMYEGRIQAKINIEEFDENGMKIHQSPYNVLSIPLVKNHLKKIGYSNFIAKKFEISIDLSRGDVNKMGTHTKKLEDGERIQISGPIMLPWWFLIAKRI